MVRIYKILFIQFFIFNNFILIRSESDNGIDSRIINGDIAGEKQFPWHVYIEIPDKKDILVCGGTIISPEWILTAAHCIRKPTEVTLKFGLLAEAVRPKEIRKTKHYFHHPKNFKHLQHANYDISLIKLNNPIQYTDYIQPVKLAKRSMTYEKLVGKTCSVCGFGRYTLKNNDCSDVLRFAEVVIVKLNTCKQVLPDAKTTTTNFICAKSTKSKDSICTGDSGGGLIYKEDGVNYIVGVISFGDKACKDNREIYQSVNKNLSWISKQTGIKIEK